MPPKKSTKTLPAPADTCPQWNMQPNAAPKLTSAVLAALREEEESDSTTNSNSNSDDDEEITNTADEGNPEAGDADGDSDSVEEIPIAVPRKRGKASKNAAMPKSFFVHISPYCIMSWTCFRKGQEDCQGRLWC